MLTRKTPIRRSLMKRKPTRPRRGSDPAYLGSVRRLPCVCHGEGDCSGDVQAHHAGTRPGVALKAPDITAIPFCMKHRNDWHAAAGVFIGMDKAFRRAWADARILDTQRQIQPG